MIDRQPTTAGSRICACGHLIGHHRRGACLGRGMGDKAPHCACTRFQLPYVAVHPASVVQGSDLVASTRSYNMARRIARALNQTPPNDRGY